MKKFLWKVIDVVGDWAFAGCLVSMGMIFVSDGIGIIRKYL